MTEPEPFDIKDETDNIDENEAAPAYSAEENRQCLSNIQGNIFRAHRFGIYASFENNGKSEMAVLFPGKGFINGKQLLGDMFKTDQELSLLFPAGKAVTMDLVSQVSRLVPESGSSLGGKTETSDKTEERKCGWVVSTLWFDQKPNIEELKTDKTFDEENQAIARCFDHISDHVMTEDEDVPAVDDDHYSWFVVTIIMPRANTAMPHPDQAQHKSVKVGVSVLLCWKTVSNNNISGYNNCTS